MKRFIAIVLVCSLSLLAACAASVNPSETQAPHIHSFDEWTITKKATCTDAGEQQRSCSCGEVQTRAIAATGHLFGEWIATKAATCTDAGEQQRSCSCGELQTQAIAATGHLFSEWTVTKAATCTNAGEQQRSCSCGELQTQAIAATGHLFGEWTVTKAATCTENGHKTRKCSNCGATENEDISATGHQWKDATCNEPITCTVCGTTNGSALGHTGNVGEKCSRCGVTVYPTVILPNTPINTAYYIYTKGRIDSLSYSFNQYGQLSIDYTITKTYQNNDYPSGYSLTGFVMKIVDEEGVLLDTNRIQTPGMSVNEKYKGFCTFSSAIYGKTNSNTIRVIIEDRK